MMKQMEFIKQTKTYLPFLLFFISCSDQSTEKKILNELEDSSVTENFLTDTSMLYSISKANAEDYRKAEKEFQSRFSQDTTEIRKHNGIINLVTQNGPVTLMDSIPKTDETESRTFQYVGQFEDPGYYLAFVQYYEGSEYRLINKKSGIETRIWNSPKLSPASNYFANQSEMLGMEGVPNGIQIWKIDKAGQTLSKFIEIDQQQWAPYNFYWETDSSLILHVNGASVENFYNQKGEPNLKDSYYLRLTIKGRE